MVVSTVVGFFRKDRPRPYFIGFRGIRRRFRRHFGG
jgi:hypothetical protein